MTAATPETAPEVMPESIKVVTAAQMVALEQAAISRGVSSDTMMENAGLAVAQAARRHMGSVAGSKVTVLVGPGNNGGDGLVTARHLRRWGAEVFACILAARPVEDPKLELARQYGVRLISVVRQSPGSESLGSESPDRGSTDADSPLGELDSALSDSRLVVDAVLGTGRARPLEGLLKGASEHLRAHRSRGRMTVLALDMPTGLDSDTGAVDPACYTADVTVALAFPKVGLLTLPGAGHAGRLEIGGIGLPPGLADELDSSLGLDLELLTKEWVARNLPARPYDSHKGTFGHALVVAGSRNYPGAASLASQAAVRVGSGLVTLASPVGVYPMASGRFAEPIHLPLPEDEDGRVRLDAVPVINGSLTRYTAALIGCGLGWSADTAVFVEKLLSEAGPNRPPLVVDADGLNNLSQLSDWWSKLGSPAVLTPHPGEMATLTGQAIPDAPFKRIGQVREWSARWGLTVALKGAYTLVGEPGGKIRVSPFANPGLASGGTGDVLSGIIVGLMAQGLSPPVAAACGVYLHGLAGDAVTASRGNAGTAATDLLEVLPETMNQVRR